MDHEVGSALAKILEKQGIEFVLNTKVTHIEKQGNGLTVHLQNKEGNSQTSISADKVLSCAGRKPNTNGLSLQALKITTTVVCQN